MFDPRSSAAFSAPSAACAALLAVLVLLGPTAFAAVTFHDIAADAGIDWVHASTTDDFQNFPETNGSGACWGDVDGDGVDDLFLVNGLFADADLNAAFDPRSTLYHNRGDGGFTDVTAAWGAGLSGWGQGCSFADHDGDGDLDLIVVGYDMLVMLRNDGDTFTDVTAASGLTLLGNCDGNPHCFGETATWADYDGDGDLDVYITQYGDYDIDVGGPVGPGAVNGMSNILFANDGDGTFTDVTDLAGVRDDPGPSRSKSFQSVWADYDRDGDPDLYIASDTTPNTLFSNNGDGTFTDVAIVAGVDDDGAGMGLVFQDINHDGLPDLYFTHYQREHNGYYLNNGDGTFEDRTALDGLDTDLDMVGWGTAATDLDNDGRVDILVVNGHTANLPGHAQAPLLYHANGDGTFTDISADAGPAFLTPSVARGAAVGDHDLDGDLDFLLLAQYNETARLIENRGGAHRFLQVELRDADGMNRYGVGAEVTVLPAGGVPLTRIIQAGNNFLGQDSQVVHAGLGAALTADVAVRWPDGTIQTFAGLAADQRVRITKDLSTLITDAISPLTDFAVTGPALTRGWYNGTVTVSLASHDRAVGTPSGLAGTEIDQGAGWQPYTMPVTFADSGVYEIFGRGSDFAGNVEPARRAAFRLDATSPVTTIELSGSEGLEGWYRDEVEVRLVASDDLAGVHRTQSRINGGDWSEQTTFVINVTGVHLVEYRSEDVAGNLEAIQSTEIRIDQDTPLVRFQEMPVVAALGAVLLQVEATDATSFVNHVAFYVDEETTPRHVDHDGGDGWSWRVSQAPGVLRVRATAVDAVDHQASAEIHVLMLAAPPTLPLGAGAGLVLVPLLGLTRFALSVHAPALGRRCTRPDSLEDIK